MIIAYICEPCLTYCDPYGCVGGYSGNIQDFYWIYKDPRDILLGDCLRCWTRVHIFNCSVNVR